MPGSFAEEMHRFENVRPVLAAAGLTPSDVVQVRQSLVGKEKDLAEYNQIYRTFFSSPFPARTTLIGCLGDVLKFETDVVACQPAAKVGAS